MNNDKKRKRKRGNAKFDRSWILSWVLSVSSCGNTIYKINRIFHKKQLTFPNNNVIIRYTKIKGVM